MTKEQERERDKTIANATANQLYRWMTNPAIRYPLNIRVDLTLKERINSELQTRRSSFRPAVRYTSLDYVDSFVPSLNAVVPVKRCRIRELDVRNTVNVAVPQRRVSLKDAALRTPFYYLSEDEARKLAMRIVHGINRELFGQRARRTNNPERVTALIAKHDKNTRQHLHCLFGIPQHISFGTFSDAIRRVVSKEQFAYRIVNIERMDNLHASIRYNVDDRKSLTDDALVYMHPIPRPFVKEHDPDDQAARNPAAHSH